MIKKPLFVDGKPIHDLNGNVFVWVKDAYQPDLPGGTDPVVNVGSYRVWRGGGWSSDSRTLRSAFRLEWKLRTRGSHVGVRLVRTVK